jgi:hypothetical protein
MSAPRDGAITLPAHLRTEAYPVYQRHQYPPALEGDHRISYERNNQLIDEAKERSKGIELADKCIC